MPEEKRKRSDRLTCVASRLSISRRTMGYHEVLENETLAELIGRVRPGVSTSVVWEHENNLGLHESRTPLLLRTGDPIWIDDDAQQQWFAVKAGRTNRFIVKGATRPFRVTLHFPDGSKVTNQDYVLEVDGAEYSGQTDAEGRLDVEVPINATDGIVRAGGYSQALKIGGLEPLHTTKGIQGRLLNLGFSPGPIDGSIGPRTIAAIRAFQGHYGLKADGVVGPKTKQALADAHGT